MNSVKNNSTCIDLKEGLVLNGVITVVSIPYKTNPELQDILFK